MKIANKYTTALLCASILGLSIPCLASEIPASGISAQKVQQEEAIVLRVEQNNVTLQAVADKDKKLTAPFSNASEFKAGDKVILSGNTLKKASADTRTDPGSNKM